MILALAFACSTPDSAALQASTEPAAIGEAECAVCGMVVGEQPSPRGQIVYRDGSHDHVCSIEELRAVVQQRSSRGTPVGIYVETLLDSFDAASTDTQTLPWTDATEAWFVFGAPRTGVMGTPTLSFTDEAIAKRHATTWGTSPVAWPSLAQTPFHLVPDGASATTR